MYGGGAGGEAVFFLRAFVARRRELLDADYRHGAGQCLAARTDALAHAHRFCASIRAASQDFWPESLGAVYFHDDGRPAGSGAYLLRLPPFHPGTGGAAGGLALRFLSVEFKFDNVFGSKV